MSPTLMGELNYVSYGGRGVGGALSATFQLLCPLCLCIFDLTLNALDS